jgi:hypothetical protein
MTDAVLPAVRESMPGKSCVLRKRFALLSFLRVAQTRPLKIGSSSLGKSISILKDSLSTC